MVGLPALHWHDEALAQLTAAQHRDPRLMADTLMIEQPQEIIDAGHRMTVNGDDEIPRLDAAFIGRALVDHLHHPHTHLLSDAGIAGDVAWHHALLAFDPDR